MKLNKDTIEILRNFANINKSICVSKGNTLRTVNLTSSVMAECYLVNQEFPIDFAIYDLNVFLGSYSNFEEPEITFNERNLTVEETASNRYGKMIYWYTDPENLLTISKMPKMPSNDILFTLLENDYLKLKKFYSSLQLSTVNGASISINGRENGFSISVSEKSNATSNIYEIPIIPEKTSGQFNFVLQGDNMNFLNGNYDVTISKQKIAKFVNTQRPLVYYVGLEMDSEYKEV